MFSGILKHIYIRIPFAILLGFLYKMVLEVIFSLIYKNYPVMVNFDEYLLTILIIVVIVEIMHAIYQKVNIYIPWEIHPFRNFFSQLMLAWLLGITFMLAIKFLVINQLFKVGYSRLQDELIINTILALFILLFLAVNLGIHMLNKWKDSEAEIERFKKENLEFQLTTLKTQVNPHFLFNSLNTLSSLVHKDKDSASNFIRKLSNVYRHVLENKDKELISLEEELKILNAYKYMAELRFGKNLSIKIDIVKSYMNYLIAPLTLQMLMENAIKHNIISETKPLLISLFIDKEDNLIVENNLQKKKTIEYSSSIGLNNIKSRYASITNREVSISDKNEKFTVKIPLLKDSHERIDH